MTPLIEDLLPVDLFLEWWRVLLIVLLFSALGTGIVAKWKERGFSGWFFPGLFLGPFAFLLVLCLPKSGKELGAGNKIGIAVLATATVLLFYAGMEAFPKLVRAQGERAAARTGVRVAGDQMENLGYLLHGYRREHDTFPPAGAFPGQYIAGMGLSAEERRAIRDPFTEFSRDYRYRPQILYGRPGWVLWSIGPDKVDDGASIRYDATNGLLSGGDIVFDSGEFARRVTQRRMR